MSASERLKALDEALTDGPWFSWLEDEDWFLGTAVLSLANFKEPGHKNTESLATLRNALPEIIAVVEAAEQGRDHSLLLSSEPAGVAMLGWRVSDAQALQSALAALDEALTTKGER